jgi:hypothetical protein
MEVIRKLCEINLYFLQVEFCHIHLQDCNSFEIWGFHILNPVTYFTADSAQSSLKMKLNLHDEFLYLKSLKYPSLGFFIISVLASLMTSRLWKKVCKVNNSHPNGPRKFACQNQTKWVLITSFNVKVIIDLLFGNIEVVTWSYAKKKAWTLVQQLDSPSCHSYTSQGMLCHAVSCPKIDYWTGTPTQFPWFGSKRLVAVPKSEVCLKEM